MQIDFHYSFPTILTAIYLKSTGATIRILLQEKSFSTLLGVKYSTIPSAIQIDWAFSSMDHSHLNAITYETRHGFHASISVSISN